MFGMGTLGLGADVATQATVAATKPNVWDQINQAITKVAAPAANVYTTIKSGQSQPAAPGVPSYTPSPYPTQPLPAAPAPEDNTKKYLLIGGAIVVVGGTIYLITRKKGKK